MGRTKLIAWLPFVALALPGPVRADRNHASIADPGPAVVLGRGGAGGDCGTTLLQAHDGTFENAYAWVHSGVVAPDSGAFAACFEGGFEICELQFLFAQIGNQAGQTMDVFVWQDDATGAPGAVLYHQAGIDPGPVATWPAVSRHDVPVDLVVTGRWWVGWWGNWPGANAGWLVAADEAGAPQCVLTNVATRQGYAAGWEHPRQVIAWEGCVGLGIQVRGVPDLVPVDVPVMAPLATGTRLRRIAPNPFVIGTEIAYDVPAGVGARLDVLDVAGRHVRSLLSGRSASGGRTVVWDGRADDGTRVAAGTYFVRLGAGTELDVARLVLVR